MKNKQQTIWISIVHGLTVAAIALFFTQVLHEFVHFLVALLVGDPVHAFNLFAVQITLFQSQEAILQDIAIEASASIVNVFVGLIALVLFTKMKHKNSLFCLFLFQLTAYNLLMGFGYFLFDGLFYHPDAPGDWKTVIRMLDGSIPLRLGLIILGAMGMLFVMFWLARNLMVFVTNKDELMSRKQVAYSILLLPYLVYGGLYSILALFHPLGFPEGFIVVFLQFFFGFSGLLWGYFLGVFWLTPLKQAQPFYPLPERISIPWIGSAALLLVFQLAILLPTIYLS